MRVPVIRNITVKTADQGTAWTLDKQQTNAHEFFFYIECICNAWFTFEILVRDRTTIFAYETSGEDTDYLLFTFPHRYDSYHRRINANSSCR